MSVNFVIVTILFFFLGFIFIKKDIFAFQILSSIFAPLGGIAATFFIFLWYLMKKNSYENL